MIDTKENRNSHAGVPGYSLASGENTRYPISLLFRDKASGASSPEEWPFLLWWVLAGSVGGGFGFAAAAFLLNISGDFLYAGQAEMVIFASLGAGIGILQGVVLLQFLHSIRWWTVASLLGGVFAGALASSLGEKLDVTLGFSVVGATIGLMQWLVLRRHSVRAGWWPLVSLVGWAAGSLVIRAADQIAVLPVSEAEGLTTGFGIIAAAAGIITGIAMNWLMQEPVLK